MGSTTCSQANERNQRGDRGTCGLLSTCADADNITRQDANARSLELLKFRNLKLWSHIFKFLYITQLSYYESFTIQVLPLFRGKPEFGRDPVARGGCAAAHPSTERCHTHNSMDSPKADRKMVCVCRTSTLHAPQWCILPRIKAGQAAYTSFQALPIMR